MKNNVADIITYLHDFKFKKHVLEGNKNNENNKDDSDDEVSID